MCGVSYAAAGLGAFVLLATQELAIYGLVWVKRIRRSAALIIGLVCTLLVRLHASHASLFGTY